MDITNALSTISKAIAGAASAALVTFLAKHNIIFDGNFNEAIQVIIAAIVGFVIVYISPKNKPMEGR